MRLEALQADAKVDGPGQVHNEGHISTEARYESLPDAEVSLVKSSCNGFSFAEISTKCRGRESALLQCIRYSLPGVFSADKAVDSGDVRIFNQFFFGR